MFKNIIISVLAVILCAGAISSRPGEESFKAWYRDRAKVLAVASAASGERKGLLQRIFKKGSESPEDYLEKCVYKDRLLWADIEVNGKVVCSGAFSRWVSYEDVSGAVKSKSTRKG